MVSGSRWDVGHRRRRILLDSFTPRPNKDQMWDRACPDPAFLPPPSSLLLTTRSCQPACACAVLLLACVGSAQRAHRGVSLLQPLVALTAAAAASARSGDRRQEFWGSGNSAVTLAARVVLLTFSLPRWSDSESVSQCGRSGGELE